MICQGMMCVHTPAQIVYNAAYDRYVLLFHADTPKFEFPSVGVAFAKEITGETAAAGGNWHLSWPWQPEALAMARSAMRNTASRLARCMHGVELCRDEKARVKRSGWA